MADAPDKPRRGSMSDDARAEIGRGHRARTRTPKGGVAVGSIDTADTLDDDDGWSQPTPIEQVIAKAEAELGVSLSTEALAIARALYDHDRRDAERTANRILAVAAAQPPSAVIAAEVQALRKRVHDVEKVAADALGAYAVHGERDRAEFARLDTLIESEASRLDATIAESARVAAEAKAAAAAAAGAAATWQADHDKAAAAEAKRADAARWKRTTAFAGTLAAALVPAVLGLLAATRASERSDATIDQIVLDQVDHETRLRALEQAPSWRSRNPFTPAPPAHPGDTP